VFTGGVETFGSQFIDIGIVDREKGIGSDGKAEERVGESRIARQCGAMEVRADHISAHDTFGAVPVALADFDGGQGSGAGTRNRATGVILEASERAEIDRHAGGDELRIGRQQFTDGSRSIDANRLAVEEPEPWSTFAGGIGKAMSEDLHSGTDREDDGSLVDGAMKALAVLEFACCLHLWSVLAAADEIEVGGVGDRVAGING